MIDTYLQLLRTLTRFVAYGCFFLLAQSNLFPICQADPPTGAPGPAKQADKNVEIPWVKGMFRHVLDPPGQKADPEKRQWYINDHCFFVDTDNTIHWFGITNPFPPRGRSYYGPGTHLHVGHASAKHPFGPWTEHKDAVSLPEDSKRFIGACFVVRHGDEYVMLYNFVDGFTTATSRNLDDWHVANDVPVVNLGHGTRDPCVVKQAGGDYFLYCTAGHKDHAAVALGESADMKKWQPLPPALLSDIRGDWGPLESPFVHRRGNAYYLFLNHSHHQYQETLVFRSENPRRFDWKKPLCMLFAHATEIFEWNGKTYLSHCGIEDRHWGNKTGLYLAELGWAKVDDDPPEK
ncbi:MAG: hypothetical protein JW888_11090 [Pirellulales bacterium]|nr:hypothetical protein [Pirellulales bacterium]